MGRFLHVRSVASVQTSQFSVADLLLIGPVSVQDVSHGQCDIGQPRQVVGRFLDVQRHLRRFACLILQENLDAIELVLGRFRADTEATPCRPSRGLNTHIVFFSEFLCPLKNASASLSMRLPHVWTVSAILLTASRMSCGTMIASSAAPLSGSAVRPITPRDTPCRPPSTYLRYCMSVPLGCRCRNDAPAKHVGAKKMRSPPLNRGMRGGKQRSSVAEGSER